MSVLIIGCLHFGHENMAKMRGFSSAKEHDENLITEWNKVVCKRDKVFILGDISMESSKPYYLLDELNGMKHVILGNHDDSRDIKSLLRHVDYISGPLKYKKDYWLTHIPVHPIEFEYRIKGNIHAHIHDVRLDDNRYFHADAKKLNYQPLSFDIIKDGFNL